MGHPFNDLVKPHVICSKQWLVCMISNCVVIMRVQMKMIYNNLLESLLKLGCFCMPNV